MADSNKPDASKKQDAAKKPARPTTLQPKTPVKKPKQKPELNIQPETARVGSPSERRGYLPHPADINLDDEEEESSTPTKKN